MSRWDGSTGTFVYLPGPLAAQHRDVLSRAGLCVVEDEDCHNPLGWLDARGVGVIVRIMRRDPRDHPDDAPRYATWGGIDWQDADQREAVLAFAEAAATSVPNRWFALCDYEGWDEECRLLTTHATFHDFRRALDGHGPGECRVHKVLAPALRYDA